LLESVLGNSAVSLVEVVPNYSASQQSHAKANPSPDKRIGSTMAGQAADQRASTGAGCPPNESAR
jgi:hypothetical protein